MKHSRRRGRGFTLVELMVSLAAGLIVTIAVVGLARAATTTFFEAARISTVESTVRTAAERFRQDLARAGYMSTGNVRLARDGVSGVPMAHKIAVINPSVVGGPGGSRYAGLDNLQGIQIIRGGSGTASPLVPGAGAAGTNNLSLNNGLDPDAVILGGNYTTDDSYQGTFYNSAGSCGSQNVVLNIAADAAVRRLISSTPVPLASVQAAFTPVPSHPFAARVVDARGCQHFVVVCGVTANLTSATVSFAPADGGGPAVIDGAGTNCGAKDGEPVTINPVQRVRWYIGPNVVGALDPALNVEPPANKFNMYREFIDADSPPKPVPEMRQVVAEYAIDLKLGLSVVKSDGTLQVFDMDDPTTGIADYAQTASTTSIGFPGPQRIRSVRFRIGTRTAVPDRNTNLVVPPGAPYITRYCVTNTPAAACKSFTRVRTIISEAALMNQLGMTY